MITLDIASSHQANEVDAALLELLLMADPSEDNVRDYLPGADILRAQDGNLLVGVGVLVHHQGVYELMNLAVHETYRNQGIAQQIINELKQLAQSRGARTIDVSTGNSSLAQLALYQKCGFRMQRIEQDFFRSYPKPMFENGIRCLDRVLLSAEL